MVMTFLTHHTFASSKPSFGVERWGQAGGNSCRVGPAGLSFFFPTKEMVLLLKGDAYVSLPAFPKTGMSSAYPLLLVVGEQRLHFCQ